MFEGDLYLLTKRLKISTVCFASSPLAGREWSSAGPAGSPNSARRSLPAFGCRKRSRFVQFDFWTLPRPGVAGATPGRGRAQKPNRTNLDHFRLRKGAGFVRFLSWLALLGPGAPRLHQGVPGFKNKPDTSRTFSVTKGNWML